MNPVTSSPITVVDAAMAGQTRLLPAIEYVTEPGGKTSEDVANSGRCPYAT